MSAPLAVVQLDITPAQIIDRPAKRLAVALPFVGIDWLIALARDVCGPNASPYGEDGWIYYSADLAAGRAWREQRRAVRGAR